MFPICLQEERRAVTLTPAMPRVQWTFSCSPSKKNGKVDELLPLARAYARLGNEIVVSDQPLHTILTSDDFYQNIRFEPERRATVLRALLCGRISF